MVFLGGLCGGVFLDEEFLDLMRKKLGPKVWRHVSNAEQKKFLNDNWENGIKPQFKSQPRSWLVDLPESCQDIPNDEYGTMGVKRSKTLQLTW